MDCVIMKKDVKKDNRVRVGVYMPQELKKQLKVISSEEEMFFQDLVTVLLEDSVKRYKEKKE